MIDEKDIRKAATLTHNPALDAVANFAARNAFIFLAESNSLKHYHVGVVYNPMDYDKNCKWWGVIEWCYIEDLLPKGGEK